MSQNQPPGLVAPPAMTHSKAIELLTILRNGDISCLNQDMKDAITLAIACIICEKLNLMEG